MYIKLDEIKFWSKASHCFNFLLIKGNLIKVASLYLSKVRISEYSCIRQADAPYRNRFPTTLILSEFFFHPVLESKVLLNRLGNCLFLPKTIIDAIVINHKLIVRLPLYNQHIRKHREWFLFCPLP